MAEHKEFDPNGIKAGEPGAKLDGGKVRAGLVLTGFRSALIEVSKVGTYGANKYSDNGWEQVPNGVARYTDAMYQHLLTDEIADPESGILHAAHAAWNALARLELLLRGEAVRIVVPQELRVENMPPGGVVNTAEIPTFLQEYLCEPAKTPWQVFVDEITAMTTLPEERIRYGIETAFACGFESKNRNTLFYFILSFGRTHLSFIDISKEFCRHPIDIGISDLPKNLCLRNLKTDPFTDPFNSFIWDVCKYTNLPTYTVKKYLYESTCNGYGGSGVFAYVYKFIWSENTDQVWLGNIIITDKPVLHLRHNDIPPDFLNPALYKE